ncbi:hypothetical protein BELL_0919g00050 [Botrytis elliptica]|uniref:Uncharacterized protein n=1 Tax=Botrytis elliptica TaxID=278938 RepID=A0A4Z1J617_9HELO|nr:hypothetical protein BELL_0919g00050 [Botrytis elliptica]
MVDFALRVDTPCLGFCGSEGGKEEEGRGRDGGEEGSPCGCVWRGERVEFGRGAVGVGSAPGEGMYAGDGGVREESREDVGALGVLACYGMKREREEGKQKKTEDRKKEKKKKRKGNTYNKTGTPYDRS